MVSPEEAAAPPPPAQAEAEGPPPTTPPRLRRAWLRPAIFGALLAAANVALYFLLPNELIESLGDFGYLGAFGSAAIANATVLVPVPYYPLLLRLGQSLNPLGVAVAAAAGSVIGELVAYFVGRSGRGAVEQSRYYDWVHRQLSHRWRAPLALFALSAPPSPFFDVAGLLAGALGVPLWIFVTATFLGRVVRMGLIVLLGQAIE